MGLAKNESELADRVSRFLKAEPKRANLTYEELADRLTKHGLRGETRDTIAAKLMRGIPRNILFGLSSRPRA